MHCITFSVLTMFMHFRCVITMLKLMCIGRFGLGWAYDVFKFACHMFMHFSCIHTFIYLYFGIHLSWCFFACLSFSLSFFWLVFLGHPKENSLYPKTLFVLGHLLFLPLTPLLLTYDSVMIKPKLFRELLTTRYSFEMPSRSVELF